MTLCKECSEEKPDNQVQLGVCDDCFRYGPPNSGRPRPTTQDTKAKGQADAPDIILTTSVDVPNRKIEKIVSIVATEVALGMNIFRDIANNWRDFIGGRSSASQKALEEARTECFAELRRKAAAAGADAVIAIDLDYNQISTHGGGSILFVAASGTAVKLTALL
ncbi:heavy metal-binding domain-containing protein [Rhizobium sp. P38BS-XIX]|nr:heavy metal-binding domain-containing protein [Rhizobium sp. P38BS-XIX]